MPSTIASSRRSWARADTTTGDYTRPPFALMWRYSGSLYGLKQWEDIEELDAYMTGPAVGQLGLPQEDAVRYLKTDSFRLFPAADVASGAYANARDPMAWVTFSTASDFDEHVNYVEGGPPAPASPDAGRPGRGRHQQDHGRRPRHPGGRRIRDLPQDRERRRHAQRPDPRAHQRHLGAEGHQGSLLVLSLDGL